MNKIYGEYDHSYMEGEREIGYNAEVCVFIYTNGDDLDWEVNANETMVEFEEGRKVPLNQCPEAVVKAVEEYVEDSMIPNYLDKINDKEL